VRFFEKGSADDLFDTAINPSPIGLEPQPNLDYSRWALARYQPGVPNKICSCLGPIVQTPFDLAMKQVFSDWLGLSNHCD